MVSISLDTIRNLFSKKAIEKEEEIKAQPIVPPQQLHPSANPYYIDTIADYKDDMDVSPTDHAYTIPKRTLLEQYQDDISVKIDLHIEGGKSKPRNFEKLQILMHKMLQVTHRRLARTDQEAAFEFNLLVAQDSEEIKNLKTKWDVTVWQLGTAGIGLFGAFAGVAPFIGSIPAEAAQKLASSSNAIGSASTSLSGFGSVLSSRHQGQEQVVNTRLQSYQQKQEDKKGSKQNNNDSRKAARSASEELNRMIYETFRQMGG